MKPLMRVLLVLLLTMVPLTAQTGAASASVPPRRSVLTLLDSTVPMGSTAISPMVVDADTQTGFVLARDTKSIMLFDASGDELRLVTSFASGLARPQDLEIDPEHHRLYVTETIGVERIVEYDVDPDSGDFGTALRSFPVGGFGLFDLAIDESAQVLYGSVEDSDRVMQVDLASGGASFVPVSGRPRHVAVDQESHTAYVTTSGSQIVSISSGAPHSISIEAPASDLAVVSGDVIALTTSPEGLKLLRIDAASGMVAARSQALAATTGALAADSNRRQVLLAYSSGPTQGIEAFNSTTLISEGRADSRSALESIAVNQVDHSVYASQTFDSAGAHLMMFGSQLRPSSTVERIDGADRYVVSAHVSMSNFKPGVSVAYVTSGVDFADALSGGPAAGRGSGPLLLATRNSIPAGVTDELRRLRPQKIVILGGKSSIGDDVETSLRGISPAVSRISGTDRYETSALISRQSFSSGTKRAYLASGEVFPDALSGSGIAGLTPAPVLLTRKEALSTAVQDELDRLNPSEVVVLGGRNTISDGLVRELANRYKVTRIGGKDRFEVSSNISARAFGHSPYTVFVASGESFPDALSASALAIGDVGPILLVAKSEIPESVKAELTRLHPYRIVVIGGTASVTEGVSSDLTSFLST